MPGCGQVNAPRGWPRAKFPGARLWPSQRTKRVAQNKVCRFPGARLGQVNVRCKAGIDLNKESIIAALMQKLDHARGTYPSVFDNYAFNTMDVHGYWYALQISIQDASDQMRTAALAGSLTSGFPEERKYTISYDCNGVHAGMTHGRHCIYLEGFDSDTYHWVGLNSWGSHVDEDNLHPKIPVHQHGLEINHVNVNFMKKLQTSSSGPGSEERTIFGSFEARSRHPLPPAPLLEGLGRPQYSKWNVQRSSELKFYRPRASQLFRGLEASRPYKCN